MHYNYHMAQIPPNITVRSKKDIPTAAATYLKELAEHHARHGWEFYRVDSIGIYRPPGCLASLLESESLTKPKKNHKCDLQNINQANTRKANT